MYAIETELGRFEAETEKDAKAKRAESKEQARRAPLFTLANLRAESNACRLYGRFLASKGMPRSWSIIVNNDPAYPGIISALDKVDHYTAQDTRAVVINGAGEIIAIILRYCVVIAVYLDTDEGILGTENLQSVSYSGGDLVLEGWTPGRALTTRR